MIVGASRILAAAVVVIGLAPSTTVAAPCYTRMEARQQWPEAHLYWHTDARCWDRSPRGARHYDERPRLHLQIMPANVAEAAPSALERAAPKAAAAEILFPALIRTEMTTAYPLFMPVAWFNPAGMHDWPLILDIDRVPFGAWDRRIGQ